MRKSQKLAALAPDEKPTPVVFRAERTGQFRGDVTAVFPTDCADMQGNMGCYAHIGQHSACTLAWYATTRAATPAEYAALKAELESAPYNYRLEVFRRISPLMHAERNLQAMQNRRTA